MMIKKIVTASALAAALALGTLPAQAAGVDMKIGSIEPLTGGNADYGIGLTTASEFGAESVTKAMKALKVAGSCKIVAAEDDLAG
jgi:ABC-type branched-subunit amino acid transport system substrate-binding protein